MPKFNRTTARPATGTSPIVTSTTPTGPTHEGGVGFGRDPKSELFLLAVANMVGESTFYEDASARDARYDGLVRAAALTDPDWTFRFLRWLRSQANMRSASLVGAVEAVKARLDAHAPAVQVRVEGEGELGVARAMIGAVCQRADEPGELLACWTARYGRAVPKPVKRGLADAAVRLYNEYGLLKYDTASHGFRFADVLDLTHPTPSAPWQDALFRHAIERRHNRGVEPDLSLNMIRCQQELRRRAEETPEILLAHANLKAAGMTWEDALSLAGPKVDKARLWAALVPSMGYMALLRNLRNFDEAGLPDDVAIEVAARLIDPAQVAKSRQFPFRFLSAFNAVRSVRWHQPLEVALNLSLTNVPVLAGRTLVLVDRSGSMFGSVSAKSGMDRADTAALFGAAVALRNAGRVDLVQYGDQSAAVEVRPGDSLLRLVREKFTNLGGTKTAAAVQRWFKGHDRVLIVTDEQAHDGNVGAAVPARVPLYTWNLGGYRLGHAAGGANRHTFAGMTDAAFTMVPLLEAGANQSWPF